ncbi:MAG: hypothetical protein ACREEK_12850 [Bradyrhizobium sp.]
MRSLLDGESSSIRAGKASLKGMSVEPPEKDDDREFRASRRRTLVFAFLGPVLGVLLAYYLVGQGYRDGYVAPIVFFFSLILCAITGPVDGALARVVPVWLRVPVTTIAGAAVAAEVAVGFQLYVSNHLGKPMVLPPLHQLISIAGFGALVTGVCSLLSHDYRRRKTRPGDVSSLS